MMFQSEIFLFEFTSSKEIFSADAGSGDDLAMEEGAQLPAAHPKEKMPMAANQAPRNTPGHCLSMNDCTIKNKPARVYSTLVMVQP